MVYTKAQSSPTIESRGQSIDDDDAVETQYHASHEAQAVFFISHMNKCFANL